ncbi:hypothetical protein HNO88_002982 [Novosphingobium chloroacetimidivorans]|uniref:Uncharacterized protein n=1 Tax=Novosphingobium chloroacetimidivorans TaxID=1428314 RepID=A0A7W7KCQ2_9SPHN|nr:hypothetical protein [Novosphingobium chloroacetimidivorans]MBB4859653.1 hypothetical protein [Novosphingobium chloroacetimidivorans]
MNNLSAAIAAAPAAPTPLARAAAPTQENDDMARMAREPKEDAEAGEGGGINGEYQRPDAAAAFKIYDEQIKPKEAHLATIKGDMSAPYQAIKDQAHFPRKVLNFIIGLENEEDAKRDHLLLALSEGLKHRQLFLPRDLVTMAAGEEGGDVIPTGEREADDLLVDEDEDGDQEEADLPLAAKPEAFSEASPEELSKQEGRGRKRTTTPPRSASIASISSPVEARPH